jgi:hypothetical protein
VCAIHGSAQGQKLPSPDKILDNYLKALGGKKAVATIRDATYEFTIELNGQPIGTARSQQKFPSSIRSELTFGNGQIVSASTASSAWEKGLEGQLRTLTGAESAAAKLSAILGGSRLVNYKKSNVLARVVSLGDLGSEPAYIVEFSTRGGARIQYYFSVKSRLITKITDDARKTQIRVDDYKPQNGILEAHRIRVSAGNGEITFVLQGVKYNTGVSDKLFDAPTSESLDVASLLKDVGKNQDETEKRVAEYSFVEKETDREITSKGVVKKETIKVYEIYPLPNREPVRRLISENGVTLIGERAAKEQKRIEEEFAKADRDKEKDAQEAAKRKAEQQKKNRKEGKDEDDDPEISQFLKVCEFVSPRSEQFEGRETIVFDFRPRPGFRPSSRNESLIAKLVGTIWIDPIDKQVIRMEARLAEGFKIGGGLLVSLKPGAALVMEQTRMVEGVWLPKFAQVNLSVKVLIFGGGDINKTVEWSEYRHFSGNVKDYKIESPKPNYE